MNTALTVLAIAWLGLITLGMMPEWGARFGLWLRGGDDLPPAPPPKEEDPTDREKYSQRLDRYV